MMHIGRDPKFFSQFTRLEQHFLMALSERLAVARSQPGPTPNVHALLRRRHSPEMELMAFMEGQSQLVKVQVHGVRPVRYHIRTSNTTLGRKLRRCISLALGERNLNLACSVQSGPALSLIYHVHYPEDILRQLG